MSDHRYSTLPVDCARGKRDRESRVKDSRAVVSAKAMYRIAMMIVGYVKSASGYPHGVHGAPLCVRVCMVSCVNACMHAQLSECVHAWSVK
jgi:hypothetical protein